MTKIRSSEISADENQEIFPEKFLDFHPKVKFVKFSSAPEHFSKIGGKSETGGKMYHGLRGDGRPWPQAHRGTLLLYPGLGQTQIPHVDSTWKICGGIDFYPRRDFSTFNNNYCREEYPVP